MNVISIRRHRPGKGRHAASPSDPFLAGGDSFTGPHPVTREAVQADREARQDLTAQAAQPTVIIPALQDPPADLTQPWRPPVTAGESRDRLARVMYPEYCGTPEQYAAVMCQVSAATGTFSRWETPAAWPRHAIETAEETVA